MSSIKKRKLHLIILAGLTVISATLFSVTLTQPVSAALDAAWCKANVSQDAPESRQDDADFKANECASVCRFTPAIDVGYVNGLPMKAPSKWTCQDSSSTTTPIANACASFSAGSDERTACEKGFTNASNPKYCEDTYKSPSEQIMKTACTKGATDGGAAPSGEKATTNPTCAGGAIGWLLCPVVNLMQIANEMMAPKIEEQLTIQPLMSGTATYAGTFKIWQMMVGLGNLVLIVGFLIVIFSQATSMGISAYGVKKLMPRIIAAAILINLSYFICAIAIDITNVIGASVKGIIGVGLDQVKIQGDPVPSFGKGLGAIMLAIGGVGVVLATGAVAYVVPAVLMIVMSLMVVFLGLALRKVVIILLIIVAPLAFAAMILPGTEGLFKKWQKTFLNLLVMYPVIAALLYGSLLVSNIILATDDRAIAMISANGDPKAEGMSADVSEQGLVNLILAYAVLGLGPAVGTYMYIKSSNKLFAMAANAVNKAGSGLRKASMGWAGEKRDRSTVGQYMKDRKRVGDINAQARGRERLSKLMEGSDKTYQSGLLAGRPTLGAGFKNSAAWVATAGMSKRAATSFRAQMAGQDNEVYRGEVAAQKELLGNKYSTKEEAYAHFWDRLRAGDAGAAEMHALHDHIMGFSGGASYMDKVWTGGIVDKSTGMNVGQYIKKNIQSGGDAWKGVQRSLLSDSSKFKGGSADAAYAMSNIGDGYVSALANGEQAGFLNTNWDKDKTATYTDMSGKQQTVKVVDDDKDPNGGLTYTGERAKNMMQMGSRLAAAQEESGKMTDEAAEMILADPTHAQSEHIVGEMAKRRVAQVQQHGPVRQAPTKHLKENQPNPDGSSQDTLI